MKLTPELLQKIVDNYEIQNQNTDFNDAMVIQCKMACSIYNQAPATDELTIEWLTTHWDKLDFCHSQLMVECNNGTESYYDYKETDDVLGMALHYQVNLNVVLTDWIAFKDNINFTHTNPALSIMGCIAQLNEEQHAYAS